MVPRRNLHCFRGVLICIYNWQPCLAVRNILVCYMSERETGSQCFPAVCEVSRGTGSFEQDPQDVFVRGRGGGGGVEGRTFLCSVCSKHTKSEWATQQPPPPPHPTPSVLAARSGNVDTWSREQPQKPQESPREDARREGEVEPWNVLGGVSHLFTSWTQWTLPESATSTTVSLSRRSLPLSSLFCSLAYPNAPHLPAPSLPSPYW